MTNAGMICFDAPSGRFNFRTAGIALRQDHVLVHRASWDTHWSLPGGRVEVGEQTAIALAREVEEELGVSGQVGPLRFVMENFFTYTGKRFHELGFYYALSLPDQFPFSDDGEICHRCRDGAADLEFKWVPAVESVLTRIDFQPSKLRHRLLEAQNGPIHIAHDEKAP